MPGPEPTSESPNVVLPGSERRAAPGIEPAGDLDPSQEVALTVVLRRRGELPPPTAGVLQRAELAAVAGADPAEVQVVERVLTGLGLQILSSDAATRTVRVSGPVGRVSQVFGTSLDRVRSRPPGSGAPVEHRHRTGELHVPAELAGIVVAVLGLDDRPQSRAHFRAAAAPQVSYTGAQLGTVYRFPPGTDGSGQTLAIIELGGGYGDADLQHYFSSLGLPVPTVRAVGVDGAGNVAGKDPQGADGEVLLDIEVAGALAPAASLVVYFAPNTDAGFLDAVNAAARAAPTPTAMSISWGQSEDSWTAQARHALDAAMADAAALGVTVAVAAGDDGSSDRATDRLAHVDFPAASPHALVCGGTALHADPTTGVVSSETVWQDPGHGATGGGVSHAFPQPAWQAAVGVPPRAGHPRGSKGRGVPDVAADADPATGYAVYVDGQAQVFGGTSAVAPCGPPSSAGWPRPSAARSDCSSRPCTPVPRPASPPRGCATSPAAATARTPRGPAGTRAPGSAYPTASRCSSTCADDAARRRPRPPTDEQDGRPSASRAVTLGEQATCPVSLPAEAQRARDGTRMQQDGLEAALAVTAGRVDTAQRACSAATRELKRAAAAASSGSVRDLRKALDASVAAAGELSRAAQEAKSSYQLDEAEHLGSGAYAAELMAAASEQGVAMYEEDERLLCYPSLIRVLAADAAIEVDRRRDKRLRPSVVVAALAAAQDRPPRFKAEAFLASLAGAYDLLAAREGKPDPVLRLDALWVVLTLLPGQARDYTRPEFARDLYLLDQSGVATTKTGRTLRWHASSETRGAGVLTTVANSGQQQRYWGASFTSR